MCVCAGLSSFFASVNALWSCRLCDGVTAAPLSSHWKKSSVWCDQQNGANLPLRHWMNYLLVQFVPLIQLIKQLALEHCVHVTPYYWSQFKCVWRRNTHSLQTNHTSFVCLKIPDKTFFFFYQGTKPNLRSYEDGWVCCITGGFVDEWWHQIIKSEDRIIIFLWPDYCCTDQSCENKPTKYLICRRRIDLQSYCMVLYRDLVSSLQLKHSQEWPMEDKLDGSSF